MPKLPEMKQKKALECFQLLSRQLNFSCSILPLIAFLREQLEKHLDSQKNAYKFEEIFSHILDGLSNKSNTSIKTEALVLVIYTLARDAEAIISSSKKQAQHLLESTQATYAADQKPDLRKNNIEKTYSIDEAAA